MKKATFAFATIFVVACSAPCIAQSGAIQSFVPEGWKLLARTDGDLNKDAAADLALLIEEIEADATGAHARAILILLKQGQQFQVSTRADKAVPAGSQTVGAKIDPAKGFRIENGTLVTNFIGQAVSGEKLDVTYTYHYHNDAFYLRTAVQKGVNGTIAYNAEYNATNGNLTMKRSDTANPSIKDFNEVREMPDIPLEQFDPAMMVFFLSAKAKSGPVQTASITTSTQISNESESETIHVTMDDAASNTDSPRENDGPTAWFQLNGNAEEVAGNGRATAKGVTPVSDRNGTANSAYSFDKKSVFTINNIAAGKFSVPFSVCAWFMTGNKDSFFQTIVSLGRTPNLAVFSLGYGLPRKKNAFYFDVNGRSPGGVQVETELIVANDWHFIVGAVDESSVKLYVDGKLIGSKSLDTLDVAALRRIMEQTNMPIEVGRDLPYLGRFFNGAIDDVMFYNRVLSEEEVKTVMQQK